jgi:hypothetical protein
VRIAGAAGGGPDNCGSKISAISAHQHRGRAILLDRSRSVLSCGHYQGWKKLAFCHKESPLSNGSSKKSHGKTQKAANKGKRVRQSRPVNFKHEAWYQHAQQAIGVTVRASQGA